MAPKTVEQIQAWMAANPPDVEGAGLPYGWSKTPACLDFNRGVYPPGYHPEMPQGYVEIRTDEDFWLCARLPYDWKNTPLQLMVEQFWPKYAADSDVEYLRDYGPADNPRTQLDQAEDELAEGL